MKVPDKSKGMKKYMVLFCIVLVSIAVSTVLAGYFGTKNIVNDIPKFESQVETFPIWEILEALSNQTETETLILNQGELILIETLADFQNIINTKHKL